MTSKLVLRAVVLFCEQNIVNHMEFTTNYRRCTQKTLLLGRWLQNATHFSNNMYKTIDHDDHKRGLLTVTAMNNVIRIAEMIIAKD